MAKAVAVILSSEFQKLGVITFTQASEDSLAAERFELALSLPAGANPTAKNTGLKGVPWSTPPSAPSSRQMAAARVILSLTYPRLLRTSYASLAMMRWFQRMILLR